jgi:Suppressor of fused protein (SUFU)
MMSHLIGHLESELGRIEAGWRDSGGTKWPFYVLRFRGGPIDDCVTYCTLGISEIPLKSPMSDKLIRHELFMMARPVFCDRNIPALLHQVGMEAIASGRARLRGELIGPRGTLVHGAGMAALYVTSPVYHPDSFACYSPPGNAARVIAWLVPITLAEALYVKAEGWESFELKLSEVDPDLLDLNRPSIV